MLGVNVPELKLFVDFQLQKPLAGNDTTLVTKLGLNEGDPIHVGNKEPSKMVVLSNQLNKPSSNTNNPNTNTNKSTNTTKIDSKQDTSKLNTKEPKENKETNNKNLEESKLISSDWHKKEEKGDKLPQKSEIDKQREKSGLTSKCTHPETSKCLFCTKPPDYKGNIKYSCNHGPNGKCPNCVSKDLIEDVKHISFDEYLAVRKAKCKGTHDSNSKCNNCTPPLENSYIFENNCKFHAPYPEGLCIKCMPPGVALGRQPYRHIDYVSFMNVDEINIFIQQWQKDYFVKQRMAYLFGYFSEDPNYSNGIRAVIEALYEPPQLNDKDSVEPLVDNDSQIVDSIASSLSLEFIGWIFTSINTDKDTLMCSYDIKKSAIYQEQYKLKHTSGYFVSKFVTVMAKPKDDGDVELQCYMVSDTFQALVRDNIIGDCDDKKVIPVRKPEKNEVLPDIFQENVKVNVFDPAFAIVSVS